ncbi:hypothetical protein IAI58_18205 (plasmid) [Roseomonas marmotae]|uniref:hypothetical protein n=1 Tax=Roseomonas marmotae TaxID=2768161 RepID=UPI001AD67FC6|nr:hypothetical protein [Roseomonas marmotae]QTI81290.1 hypothetical protein IAI58_18205 [Roseomonas marmotae]
MDGEVAPIDPVFRPGAPGREAEAGYAAAARAVGHVPPRGSPAEEQGEARLLAPPPALPGLEALLPGGGAGLVLPLALAALRPDPGLWLGEERLARLGEALHLPRKAMLTLLGGAPQPPASLGEAAFWAGQRLPLRSGEGLAWIDLFWRPDRVRPPGATGGNQAGRGAFAIRLALPVSGRIELRGRLEERRLDAVLETVRRLPPAMVAELEEAFEAVLHRLALSGSLTVRHRGEDQRP